MDKQVTQDSLKVAENVKADIGRTYPHEFLEMVADDLETTLREIIKKAQLPDKVTDLVGDLVMMTEYAVKARAGVLSEIEASLLVDTLAESTQRMVELGGIFYSSHSYSIPRPINLS